MEKGLLIVKRIHQRKSRFRRFWIYIDGERRQPIKDGEAVSLELPIGKHDVQIRQDIYRSQKTLFDLKAGETVSLECGSPIQGIKLIATWLYALIPIPGLYIYLKKK
ncbi:hypothetical protein JXR74_07300 [Candidatus Mcinerneyibacteriota bacterium]|nr:hypothetical protein [Candidatus Mcinerneyibacteriota bacterium]